MKTSRCAASWKAIPVERHGKAVMECVTETARHAAILVKRHGIVVTECVTEGISDHRM